MTLAKVKEQDGMTLAKVKEQDGMTCTFAKVRHAQVSHAPRNIPYGQSSQKLKLARAEPSKLTTSSGKALETYN